MINLRHPVACVAIVVLLVGVTPDVAKCVVLESPSAGPIKVFPSPQMICAYLNAQSTGGKPSDQGMSYARPGTPVKIVTKGSTYRCGGALITIDEVEYSNGGQAIRGYVLPGYVKPGP